MPIILDDLQNTPVVQSYDPKRFFSTKLTGRGGKSAGRLSAKNNPINIDANVQTDPTNAFVRRKEYKNKFTNTTQIPLNPIYPERYNDLMHTITMPELNDMVIVGKLNKDDIYMHMTANAIILEETSAPANTLVGGQPVQTGSKIKVNYLLFFFTVRDTNDRTADNEKLSQNANKNSYLHFFSDNPLMDTTTDIYQYLTAMGCKLNGATIRDYISNFDLYTSVVKLSEIWQTTIHKTIDDLLSNTEKALNKSIVIPGQSENDILRNVYDEVRYIMSYNVPLDLYKNIYQSINKHFQPDVAKKICKQNLNLMLSDTMNSLNNNKANIASFTIPQNVTEPQSVQRLSPEQHNAVTSTEPLILVQAGAGTGKSTLILGRIDYLTACGVNPADITVLSFTNAAADHIKEKNPNVHSMTIASMIHEIYSANFGDHNLSSLDTIYNSIDIYFPTTPQSQMTNDIPHAFQRRILSIIKNDANAVTQMNNFIEENYDEVINILNTVKQTTLELEIIICYQKIGTFKEPSSVQSKFLIIDEVQDNSIFEFIYMLRYIEKHKESLFIVGDCSQTLYEFRASNPRALNILENSNTFATYQLNVNYRSNQEILDFANVALLGIEANQYARIQLQANSMAKVTEQSFLDRVFFNYHQLKNQKDFHEALDTIMVKEIKPYIDQCIARNEQVAFLSYTRRDISRIQEILERMYPAKQAASLVPQKTSNMTLFSNYIKQFWSELKWAPTQDIVAMIVSEINNRLDRLIKYVKDPVAMASSILSRWIKESSATINMWSNMVTNGQLTHDKFLNLVKENMLQYEIRYNAIHQSLTSAKNQTNKNSDASKNATFLLSTIHSAKGLEFDNVVVCYKNKECNNEESKRMYYVAFTRAMKSEYILAYDTVASPQIEADYLTVLKKLHDIAPAANSPLDKPSKNMKIKI